ncbi:unnamed protein product [Medioppia subpectinata]|uniref:Tudor domain-containing protein 1 n=1 Tax=Medioppia subpectinata TaxID=1979941 RepID=A0A7R9KIS1_9ACAR|nr:unnamed protein product [Medioppia subpectinata]CAG2104140.1 unnamed protein product [Medioppia subpectinata]
MGEQLLSSCESWDGKDYMADAFNSVSFNSYSSGQLGANLPVHLLPPFGSQLSGHNKSRQTLKLSIDGFPSDITESGLKGYLQRIGCKPSTVKRVKSQSTGQCFSFADFVTTRDALDAIQAIRSQKLFRLSVCFASTESDLQEKHHLLDKERQHLLKKHLEMKPKLDIGDNVAINANNCHTNGKSFDSDNESHGSNGLDILSPLASSDKLLKVLNKSTDDCSFCSGGGDNVDHLHFILDDQQVIDPKQLPPLIALDMKCQKCGQKSVDMKLCSQCKSTRYCNTKCQSSDWLQHKMVCKTGGTSVISLNASKRLITSAQVVSPPRERTRTPPPISQSKVTDSPVIVDRSPKVTFNKTSVNDVTDSVAKKLVFDDEPLEIEMKSFLDYKHDGSDIDLVINENLSADDFRYLATIFDPSIGRIIKSLSDDYKNESAIVPKVGDLVVGRNTEGRYFRAHVLSVDAKSAKMFLIDDSNVLDVSFGSIYEMLPKYLKAPSFGVVLVPDTRAAGLSLEALSQTEDSILKGSFTKTGDKFFAKSNGNSYEILGFKSIVELVKQCVNTIGLKPKNTNTSVDYFSQLSTRNIKINRMLDSMALYKVETDPKVFFIADEGSDFEQMMTSCAELGATFDDKIKVKPSAGGVYLARSVTDGEWYRAVVLELKGDECCVQYIDFGNNEEISVNSLMKLSDKMTTASVAPIAIKCKVDETKLSDENLHKKIDQAIEGQFLLKIKILNIENSVHSVEVY